MWLYEGSAAWHFVTLPRDLGLEIQAATASAGKRFGTVKVTVMAGRTRWKTSLFRDNARGSYVLPLKAAVREKEQMRAGETIEFVLIVEPSA